MWCAIAAYVVIASGYADRRRVEITVKEMRIAVVDTAEVKVISSEKVARTLAEAGINPVGVSIDSLDVHGIESVVAALPEVRRASAWCDLEGTLTVRVEGRTPIMRVRSSGGYRFWLSDDGYIIPDRGEFGAYVPVVTGSIPFPFGARAAGSYEEMRRANYNDYLGQFTDIEGERVRIAGQLAQARASLRATRASGPKRFWSEGRKKRFDDDKAADIARLNGEIVRLDTEVRSLAARRAALVEKEKKSYQSYLFLTKLANFVRFIERDDFWSAQIVQINVPGGGSGVNPEGYGADRAGRWKEPELELVPRAGDHIVALGALDGTEGEKLEKLRLFYLDGLRHEGWDKFGRIDIKYKNQIVCTQ